LNCIATQALVASVMTNRSRRIGVAAALLCALIVRVVNIDAHALWWDEIVSVSNATGSQLTAPITRDGAAFTQADFWSGNSIATTYEASIQDSGNSVLYYMMLHFWILAFGISDFSVRLPSVIFGAILVVAIFALSHRTFGPRAAWAAAGLAVFHPLLVRYSQEARGHSLATLFGVVGTWLFLEIAAANEQSRSVGSRLGWVAYGLSAVGAILAHYLSVAVFLGHILYAIFTVRRRSVWVRLVAAGCLAGLALGVWFAHGGARGLGAMSRMNAGYEERSQLMSADENFALPATPRWIAAGALQMLYAISGNLLQRSGLRLSALLPLLSVPLTLLVFAWKGRGGGTRMWGLMLLLGVSNLALAGILALRSGHIVSFQPHYGLFSTPYVVILMAVGLIHVLDAGRLRPAVLVVGGQLAIIVASVLIVYQDIPLFRPPNPLRATARVVATSVTRGDEVVFESWYQARLINLYLPPSPPIRQRIAGDHPGTIAIVTDGNVRILVAEPRVF